jgi:hypothetical protein
MAARFFIDRRDLPRATLWVLTGLLVIFLWPMIDRFAHPHGEPSIGHLLAKLLVDWSIRAQNGAIRPLGVVLDGALFAAVTAVPQWLILRKRFSAAGSWGLATFAGITLAALASRFMYEVLPKEQIFLNEAQTTFTYRLLLGYALLSAALSSLIVGLLQFAVLWRRVSYAHWWVIMAVLVSCLIRLIPFGWGATSLAVAVGVVIDAYVLFLLLRGPAPELSPAAEAQASPARAIRWGWSLIVTGIATKLVGMVIAESMKGGPYADAGLRGMLAQLRDAGRVVTVQATSDILLGACLLVGIILLVRGYRLKIRGQTRLNNCV